MENRMSGPSSGPPVEREYPYRPKWPAIALCALFFGAGAAFMAHMALSNDRGLVINGIIELSSEGARVFYWIIAGLFAAFVLLAAMLVAVRLTSRQRVVLTPEAILVPRGSWSSEDIALPFAEISDLVLVEVQGERFLNIIHEGRKYTLAASLLPSKEDFDAIRRRLEERAGATAEAEA